MVKYESVQNATRCVRLINYPDVMNIEQISEILGVSVKTGYKMLREKSKHKSQQNIPYIRGLCYELSEN